MRALIGLMLLLVAGWCGAADELAGFTKNNVSVLIALERGEGRAATLVATFTPDAPDLHLYASDLPEDAEAGVATRIDPTPAGPLVATGKAVADKTPHLLEGLPVYPEGPVTLRLPVLLP